MTLEEFTSDFLSSSTLIAVNNISNVRSLRSGQKLTVPSLDGLNYCVASGDTIEGLSAKYKVSVEDLLDVNDLSSSVLQKGQKLNLRYYL